MRIQTPQQMEGESSQGVGSGGNDGPAASPGGGPTSHRAAADELMKLIDHELDQAHLKIDDARREADEARQNAAAAAEVARRYRTRNYRPVGGLGGDDAIVGGDGGAGADDKGVPAQEPTTDDMAQMQTIGPNDVALASSPTAADTSIDENLAVADVGTNGDIADNYDQGGGALAVEPSSIGNGAHEGSDGPVQAYAEEYEEEETTAIRLNDTQDDEGFHDASEHHEAASDDNHGSMTLEDLAATTEALTVTAAAAEDDAADDDSAFIEEDYEGSVNDATSSTGAEIATPCFDKSMSPLPAGWVETMDQASGTPYYYREVDGYTTWERPVAEDAVPDEQEFQQQYDGSDMPQQQQMQHVEEPQSRPDQSDPQREEGWGTTTPDKQILGTPSSAAANILTPTLGTAVHDNIRSPLSVQSARSAASGRLARSNAEDVLAISLELETAREQVDKERSGHQHAKAELAKAREANQELEKEIQKLNNQREELAISHSNEVDGLRIELNRARHRVTAAEEDANLALDIAKGSAESREQLEGWLQRALDEIEILRQQLATATAVGPGGGQVILIGSPTSTPNQKHTPRPPPPRSSQDTVDSRERTDDDGTSTNVDMVDLGIGSPLTSIAEEGGREHTGGNAHATTPKQRPPLPPPSGNPIGSDAAASNGGAAAVMQRSKSATTTTVTTTVTTTESTTEYVSGETRSVPPPPVQTPSNTPLRESVAPQAMVAAGRAILGKSVESGSAQAKQRTRSERLAALVHSSKEKQHRLEEKLRTNDKMLANSTLAKVENRLAITDGRANRSEPLVDPSLVRRVALLLSESGTKLALGGPRRRDGRWGLHVTTDSDEETVGIDNYAEADGIDLESLVTDYCTSVEAKVGKVEEEIEEVRAFCEYLEKKVITEPLDI